MVTKAKGYKTAPGKRTLECKRKNTHRMTIKMNINTDDGNDHVQARFDYDFKDTALLDLIEQRVQEGIVVLNPTGNVTSDEALDFFQTALMAMSTGTALVREEIVEE